MLSLERAGKPTEVAEQMIFWAALGGILGARVLSLLTSPQQLFADPLGTIFGGAGFVFYGGLIGGTFAVWMVFKKNNIAFLHGADLSSPALCVGYAVGRIGCQLSGDGDYGMVSDLPWAMGYPLGVISTPPGVLVHPTPFYESIGALIICFILLNLVRNKKFSLSGQIFGLYLCLSAVARFLVEFIRIEQRVFANFSQAQVVSMILFSIGAILIFWPARKTAAKSNSI